MSFTKAEIRAVLLVALGLASGVSTTAIGIAELATLWFLPGVGFAAFVVVPWALWCGEPPWQVITMAVRCVVGYMTAHAISMATDLLLAPVGAAAGTYLMLMPALSDQREWIQDSAWRALIVGTAAAMVFPILVNIPEGGIIAIMWIAGWQLSVAAALAPAILAYGEANPADGENSN
ncbi:MAG: hypothetical protein ACRC1K_18400 [Planctomycetia bacterium]